MMCIYRCGNKRCREYQKEFQAMDPWDARLATGRPVRCNSCGSVAWFVRNVPDPEDSTPPHDPPQRLADPEIVAKLAQAMREGKWEMPGLDIDLKGAEARLRDMGLYDEYRRLCEEGEVQDKP